MAFYGRDFSRYPDYGWGRYDRVDFGPRPGGRYYRGERPRGDWGGAERYFDEPREPWGRRHPGWGRERESGGYDRTWGSRFDALPPGDWEAGEPWGGEGDVDRIRVAEIMTRNPETVTPDTSLAEVARRMRDLDVGIMPVVGDEESFQLKGVITDRDIAVRAVAEERDMKEAKVRDYMTTRVEAVEESDHVREVFTVMKREQVRRVPVVDSEGSLVGIVAQADLAVNYAGLNLQRETEVEEVIERISEPARPRRGRENREETARSRGRYVTGGPVGYDRDLGDRLRQGWRVLRREARHLLGRGYDRGW